VKYDLQYVKKGDKILELYSPEINTFQEEHLFLLKSEKEKSLLEQSKQKLKLLGITENQILQLEKNKTFTQTIRFTVHLMDMFFSIPKQKVMQVMILTQKQL
jgi:Cu(I)/Ag(I) efflux system membrane fusion protein